MFTEQPAPPPTIAEVQTQPTDATVSPAPARVAPPETLPAPAPAPVAPVAPPVVEVKSPAPVAPLPSPTSETAIVQRQQEIEQKLLELTQKARAAQKERQQQQAATEAAKYGEAGDLAAAEQAINNPALPANVRAALQKRLQAKQAKQGATAQKQPAKTPSTANVGVSGGNSGVGTSARDYSSAPIVPLSQAQLRLRLGQLIGRNLDFSFPLSIPAPITSMFGWRIHPISGAPRFHRGIDFGAPMGTPIVAAKAGRVTAAEDMDGYGLAVIVQHGNAQQTLYGHMSQMFVRPGQTVKKGELLGLVGSTGNSTGPHLHFEIHELTADGWVALDPAIAMGQAIALAQDTPAVTAPSTKPYTFNLAASGLLDLNAPAPTFPNLIFGNTFLANLLPVVPTPLQPAMTSSEAVQVPLTLLPSTLPELSWLLSPLLADLMDEWTISLPGLTISPTAVSFSDLPALSKLPPSQVSDAIAFDPNVVLPAPSALRVANSKPLAGLTLPQQKSAQVSLATQPPYRPRALQPSNRDHPLVQGRSTPPLKLSDKPTKPLNGG